MSLSFSLPRRPSSSLGCFELNSGAIGSGLAILSAHPIHSSFIHPFSLNGHPLHFIEGDFFAGKSVCGVCIEVEGVGLVDVLNSHMYAPGGEGEGVEGAHRVAQAWELAKIVKEKAERGRHVLVVRDPLAFYPLLAHLSLALYRRPATSTPNPTPSSSAYSSSTAPSPMPGQPLTHLHHPSPPLSIVRSPHSKSSRNTESPATPP